MASISSPALSKAQISSFHQQGFLHLKNWLPKDVLDPLSAHIDLVMKQAIEAEKSDYNSRLRADSTYTYSFAQPFLKILDNIHLHMGASFLPLLALPQITDVISSLCGAEYICVKDVLVCKNKYERIEIPWHQDLITMSDKKYPAFALGIYLDDSTPGDGAVDYMPGTQSKKYDFNHMPPIYDEEIVTPEVQVGDIVIHDLLVLHKSDPLKYNDQRRTLYYEFRQLEQVTEVEKWPSNSIECRLNLMRAAQEMARVEGQEHQAETLEACYQSPIPFNFSADSYSGES